MHILRHLQTVEKDIKQHLGIANCKLTKESSEIQLIFYGYDERMEEIVQYCKQQLETELEKTFTLHHCKIGKKPKSSTKEDMHLYRFTEEK